MYQPYPPAGRMPEPARPDPPQSVLMAVKLMYAGAAISAISLIVSLSTISSIRSAAHRADPSLTSSQLHSVEVFVVSVAVVSGLIGVGLWVWMAVKNKAGRSWARIVGTVLFSVDTLFLLLGSVRAGISPASLVAILIWLIGLATVVLLWRAESTAFFQARSARY